MYVTLYGLSLVRCVPHKTPILTQPSVAVAETDRSRHRASGADAIERHHPRAARAAPAAVADLAPPVPAGGGTARWPVQSSVRVAGAHVPNAAVPVPVPLPAAPSAPASTPSSTPSRGPSIELPSAAAAGSADAATTTTTTAATASPVHVPDAAASTRHASSSVLSLPSASSAASAIERLKGQGGISSRGEMSRACALTNRKQLSVCHVLMYAASGDRNSCRRVLGRISG
jgi:hypothetical protein